MSTLSTPPVPSPLDASLGARVRAMRAEDLARVAEIERASFTTPWSAATFQALVDRSDALLRVVEAADVPVAAYGVLWCIADQGELANIAVVETLRGRGIGAFLLDAMIAEARARGVVSLYLEVRTSNVRARSMYASRGFEEIGRRRDYYEKPREDARVLVKRL